MNGGTFYIGKWFDLFSDSLVLDLEGKEEKYSINVEKPKLYDLNFPEIELLDKKYNIYDMEDNYNYFSDLKNGSIKIVMVDDHYIENTRSPCDYCFSEIQYPLRFCKKCNLRMCSLCWEEKTEEDAIRNGAINWQTRKDKLMKCFSHIFELEIEENLKVNCDICPSSSSYTFGKWFSNRSENKDICPSCFYTEEGQKFISETETEWKTISYINNNILNLFGSFLDWIVLFEHEEDNDFVLYNINKGSKFYHTLCLVAVDNNKNCGFYRIGESLNCIVNKINSGESIKDILTELNHETYFG